MDAKRGGATRLYFLKFIPEKWLAGTRDLSLSERGVLADLMCFAFLAKVRGALLLPNRSFARLLGCSLPTARGALRRLIGARLVTGEVCNRSAWVRFEWMARAEAARKKALRRLRRHRAGNASETPMKRTEDRGKRIEDRGQRTTTGAPSPRHTKGSTQAAPAAEAPRRGKGSGSEPAPKGTNNNDRLPVAGGRLSAAPRTENREPTTGNPAPPKTDNREPTTDATKRLGPALAFLALAAAVPPAEVWKRLDDGHDARRVAAWLLVVKKRAPHDPERGGPLAYFRGLLKKCVEPPDWALAGAKLLLQKDRLSAPEADRLKAAAQKGGVPCRVEKCQAAVS